MKGLKYKLPIALLLIGNTSVAQEVTPEVQELVNKLAADGFKEFRLEDGPFTQLRLIAEIDGQALELILDPNTQEVIKTRVSFDDNGDGKIDFVLKDSDHNGKPDMIGKDTNDDGRPDIVAIDKGENGTIDIWYVDTNYDGKPDATGIDTNGDGKPDKFKRVT